jgi:hypothetical protein
MFKYECWKKLRYRSYPGHSVSPLRSIRTPRSNSLDEQLAVRLNHCRRLIRSSTRRIPCKQASASASSGDPHRRRVFHAVTGTRPAWSRTTIPALAAPVSLQNSASVFSFTHPASGGFHTSFCRLIWDHTLHARSSLVGLSIVAFPFTSVSLLPFVHNPLRVAW